MTLLPNNRLAVLAIATLLVGLVGEIDYVTGTEIRVTPLYFLSISYVAWMLSRRSALAFAAFTVVVWIVSNWMAGVTYTRGYIWVINASVMYGVFATVALLVTELRLRLQLEQTLSRQDVLTGVLNRRAFLEQGGLLLSLARRENRPLTLAYFDLDDFKGINDRHGHTEGDRALVAVATALQRQLRATDLLARIGGDEFAVLLLDAGPEDARLTLERARQDINARMSENSWLATASVGGVSYAIPPATIEEAIGRADALMYCAKECGKDRVTLEVVDAQRQPARVPESSR